MKILLTLYLIFIFQNFNLLSAQSKFYVNADLGYQSPLFGYENYSYSYLGNKSEKSLFNKSNSRNLVFPNLNFCIGVGYQMSKRIALDANFIYTNSQLFQKTTYFDEGFESNDKICRYLIINPSFNYFFIYRKKLNIYVRLGFCYGKGSMYNDRFITQDVLNQDMTVEYNYSGGYFFGGNLGIGIQHDISNNIKLIGELSIQPLLYNPTISELTKRDSMNVSILNQIPIQDRTIKLTNSQEFNASSIPFKLGLQWYPKFRTRKTIQNL